MGWTADGPKRPARLQAAGLLLPLLYFLKIENKSRKKGEERKVEIEFWARGLFSRTRKNMLVPRKIERGMIERFKFKLI